MQTDLLLPAAVVAAPVMVRTPEPVEMVAAPPVEMEPAFAARIMPAAADRKQRVVQAQREVSMVIPPQVDGELAETILEPWAALPGAADIMAGAADIGAVL